MKSFTNIEHECQSITLLDESFTSVDTPPGFKGALLPHQGVVISALLDLENNRKLQVAGHRVESNAIVLSEPFGSGKTIILLSLILLNPIPKAFPFMANHAVLCATKKPEYHQIKIKYVGTKLINHTLIVVGASVLIQWFEAIKQFTPLRVVKIDNYYDIVKFRKSYEKNSARADIILLKNGLMSGNLDGVDTLQCRSSVAAMAGITTGGCWARVIFDDFDSIKIPTGITMLPALSTIFVSATKNYAHTKYAGTSWLNSIYTPLSGVINDSTLFTNFNIRSHEDFISASISMPNINAYACIYDNPDDNYIKLIGAMGDMDNIMEMLNGDAINAAADALNIKTTSIADIFEKLLDTKYDQYIYDQKLINVLQKAKDTYLLLPVRESIQGRETDRSGESAQKAHYTAIKGPYAAATI